MQGLLAAFMNPPADDEAGFNAWYDDEHTPLRLTVPGFLSARRYRAVEPEGPRYFALYDLESPGVLDTPAYQRLNLERSEREQDMFARIPMVDRRVLEVVVDGAAWSDAPPYQLTVGMTPPAGGEDDFVAWYRQEHIRMLLAIPGWRRVRLFRQLEGDGPAFLAIHELETPAVFDQPAYAASIATPWRQRIRQSVSRYDRSLWALWRSFL
ncbi:MAG TPA: hypothetical protein VF937_02610 [Chloroflexota bacterium]